MDQVQALRPYHELMTMDAAASVYHEAIRCGLLDALLRRPRTDADLAAACGTARRPTTLVLDVLAGLHILTTDTGWRTLTPLGQALLESPCRQLNADLWGFLNVLLKTDRPLVARGAATMSDQRRRRIATLQAWMYGDLAEKAISQISLPRRDDGLNILHIGPGSAVWSLALAPAPRAAAFLRMDWVGGAAAAAAEAQRRGLAERFTAIAGDWMEATWPAGPFDVAVLGHALQIDDAGAAWSLLRRVKPLLRPDGRLIITETLPQEPHGKLQVALHALTLAMREEHGRLYATEEILTMLGEAGFTGARIIPLPGPPHTVGVIEASLPA